MKNELFFIFKIKKEKKRKERTEIMKRKTESK